MKISCTKNTKVLLHLPWPAGCCLSFLDVTRHYDVISRRHVTSWRHAMTSHGVLMSLHSLRFGTCQLKSEKPKSNVFWPDDLDLWPMTLTIKLVRDIIKVNPCTKSRDHTSIGSPMRAFTRTHTHPQMAPFFITSTADAGGNNLSRDYSRSLSVLKKKLYRIENQTILSRNLYSDNRPCGNFGDTVLYPPPLLGLTASSTGHICNEDIFARFIETNCMQWIPVIYLHMGCTCLAEFVHHR